MHFVDLGDSFPNWSSLSMYFSYVPSIIFSFFNHPLFLNLLFKQILIQYHSIVSLEEPLRCVVERGRARLLAPALHELGSGDRPRPAHARDGLKQVNKLLVMNLTTNNLHYITL